MMQIPGEAGDLCSHLQRKGGRPAASDKGEKLARAIELRAQGVSLRQIEKEIGVPKSTVERWLFDYDSSQKHPVVGQFRDAAEPDGETPH